MTDFTSTPFTKQFQKDCAALRTSIAKDDPHCEPERGDIIKRAKEIILHGRTITYPSITSAEHVRDVMAELVGELERATSVYDSAVKGRSDFRDAYRASREEAARLRDFAAWIDTWVSNPVVSYAYPALAGLFIEAREKLATLPLPATED